MRPGRRKVTAAIDRVAVGPSWGDVRDLLTSWVEADPEMASDLLEALCTEGAPENSGARRTMASQVITALTLHPDRPRGIVLAVQNPAIPGDLLDALTTETGYLPPDLIDATLAELDPGDDRQLRCGVQLGQHRLLRHHDLGAAGSTFHDAARNAGLGSAWLPPDLHELELDLRCWLPFGGAHQLPRPEPQRPPNPLGDPQPIGALLERHGLTPSVWPADQRCRVAWEDMTLTSNGRILTTLFDTGRSRADHEWETVIGPSADATPIPARVALQSLFAAAYCAGAYSRRRAPWRARLHMGQCLAGWVGADPMESFAEVLDASQSVTWFRIATETEWFHDIAWDSAILAIDRSGESATLLAATDTD